MPGEYEGEQRSTYVAFPLKALASVNSASSQSGGALGDGLEDLYVLMLWNSERLSCIKTSSYSTEWQQNRCFSALSGDTTDQISFPFQLSRNLPCYINRVI